MNHFFTPKQHYCPNVEYREWANYVKQCGYTFNGKRPILVFDDYTPEELDEAIRQKDCIPIPSVY